MLWKLTRPIARVYLLPSFLRKKKMHKTTLLEDDMRKILQPKIWSLGTALGYLGPLSQEALHQIFPRLHFLVIWTPYGYPELVVSETQAKIL